jgi:formate/nitrite transporter FocA (FNT family)
MAQKHIRNNSAYNILLQWWLMNNCGGVIILLNFSNKFKLTEHKVPLHCKAINH